MNCKECKHFNEHSDGDRQHVGWCDIVLPRWLFSAVNIDRYEFTNMVRADDNCSFWVDKK